MCWIAVFCVRVGDRSGRERTRKSGGLGKNPHLPFSVLYLLKSSRVWPLVDISIYSKTISSME